MKKEQPIIVGLDIGTTKVAVIAGRLNSAGKLQIIGNGHASFEAIVNGSILNVEQCTQAIDEAMKKCLDSAPGLDVKDIYMSVGGEHIKSFQTRGNKARTMPNEEINAKEVEQLTYEQFKTSIPANDEIIDIIPQKFILDNTAYVADPVGMLADKLGANFHIVTGNSGAIRNIKRCADRAGVSIKGMLLQSLASAKALIDTEDMEAGVAVVDIGGGTTDIAIYQDGILAYTAVIPYGGVNITNRICNELGVLHAQAEQIKIQYGRAISDEKESAEFVTVQGLRGLPSKDIPIKDLSAIIQQQVREILDYVAYHLKQANLSKPLHGGVILTGGGAQLKHITKLAESFTGLPVRVGYADAHFAEGQKETLMNPMYATCIGLILHGYKNDEKSRQHTEIAPLTDTIVIGVHEEEGYILADPDGTLVYEIPKKRQHGIKKMFGNLKGKFIGIFEDQALS